jgi:hypothetical protein
MDMHDLESSFLKAVGYDENYKRLELHWIDGRQYEYFHVPADVYLGFLAAESHGEFYNAYLKGKYDEKNIIGAHFDPPKKKRRPPVGPFQAGRRV